MLRCFWRWKKSAAIHQSFAWRSLSVDGASKGQKSWLQNSISEPSYHSSSAMTWHTKWGQNAATAGLLVLRMLWLEGDWILFSQSWIKCKWVSSKLKFNWLSELRKQQLTSDRSPTHPHTHTHKTHKTSNFKLSHHCHQWTHHNAAQQFCCYYLYRCAKHGSFPVFWYTILKFKTEHLNLCCVTNLVAKSRPLWHDHKQRPVNCWQPADKYEYIRNPQQAALTRHSLSQEKLRGDGDGSEYDDATETGIQNIQWLYIFPQLIWNKKLVW